MANTNKTTGTNQDRNRTGMPGERREGMGREQEQRQAGRSDRSDNQDQTNRGNQDGMRDRDQGDRGQ